MIGSTLTFFGLLSLIIISINIISFSLLLVGFCLSMKEVSMIIIIIIIVVDWIWNWASNLAKLGEDYQSHFLFILTFTFHLCLFSFCVHHHYQFISCNFTWLLSRNASLGYLASLLFFTVTLDDHCKYLTSSPLFS